MVTPLLDGPVQSSDRSAPVLVGLFLAGGERRFDGLGARQTAGALGLKG